MLKSIIFYGLLASASLLLVFTVLEIFLSDNQKHRLQIQTLRLWSWLDEAKKRSLLRWLQDRSRVLTVIAVTLATLYAGWVAADALRRSFDAGVIIIALVLFFLGLLIGLNIIRVTLRAPTLFWATVRATLFVLLVFTPVVAFFLLSYQFKDLLLNMAHNYASGVATGQLRLVDAISALLFIFGYVFVVHCTVLALIFWATVTGPLVVIYTTTILLFVAELIARRISEYNKGVLFAGIALMGALATLLKVLN
jgi:hypothetical protein